MAHWQALRSIRVPGDRYAPLAISVALHAVLFATLALVLPGTRLKPPPPVESLPIEFLSEAEIAALLSPTRPITTPSAAPAEPTPRAPALEPLPLAHAKSILSGEALDKTARESLVSLATPARFEQICDVEAMEQIARSDKGFHPTRAVAYAITDPAVQGNVMLAHGAAFLSDGLWYRLSFRCETSPDRLKVVSFDFAIGGVIDEGRGLGAGAAD